MPAKQKMRVWFVFIYLPETVSSGPWVMVSEHFYSRRKAQKWVKELWDGYRVRYVPVDMEVP